PVGAIYDGWLLRKQASCDEVVLIPIKDGQEETPSLHQTLHRGEICMTWGEPDPVCVGSGCTPCHQFWCEEPPACEDEP
ncbi:MAG: hypothetical protein KDK70_43440, partial [Myxococcales bacterium]|nr:hypothetical protein [Myxococcales bacterium]